jgi:AAA domain
MGIVADFEQNLRRRARATYASWHRVDLHNHSPTSRDYRGDHDSAASRTAEQIRATDLSIVMFTDHERLPEASFTSNVANLSGTTILRGVELNVFVDAWQQPEGRVGKNLFFHLLVGFDPDGTQSPDYWLDHIYRECGLEKRQSGNIEVKGITVSLDRLYELLRAANAIIIPAHLHSDPNAFKSRSIDDIYQDPQFLRHAREHFTALEVTSASTAAFFDGKHEETGGLQRTCIRSSDSHEPESLGSRCTYVQLQTPSFLELKAALELPFRTSLEPPVEPPSYVLGVHIHGQFFPDLWLTFSPHCNVFIGVKGSGKTSVLECLRFVLGTDIPQSRLESVQAHVNNILGPAGTVRALIKRADGAKLLVERSAQTQKFLITFEDDRRETISKPEALLFPAYIHGWHEIEQAATDPNIRRLYLDTIAGRELIHRLDEEAESLTKRIRHKHDAAANKYSAFLSIHEQVERLDELRRGLKALDDENLIELRAQYDVAVTHREELERCRRALENARDQLEDRLVGLLPGLDPTVLEGASPLQEVVRPVRDDVQQLLSAVDEFGTAQKKRLEAAVTNAASVEVEATERFASFYQGYEGRLAGLTAEQRRLLESHQKVMEETKALVRLRSERDELKRETQQLLSELADLCSQVVSRLEERTHARQSSVEQLDRELKDFNVHLSVEPFVPPRDLREISQRYSAGAKIFNEVRAAAPEERRLHRSLQRAYERLREDLLQGYHVFFEHAEFGNFLGAFEEDDLKIHFAVGKAGEEYSPIDQLSAGQRCTAIFPLLLRLQEGPLVIDQPEDNLDNRYIADWIAKAILTDKRSRQILFTSHNANLVVLSDPEQIVTCEASGSEGRIEERGFSATRYSPITKHVLDILDGGERALELRYRKYGALGK